MASFTNTAQGLRGILLKDGNHIFVEPDATVEVADKDVASAHPDLTKSTKKASASDDPPQA